MKSKYKGTILIADSCAGGLEILKYFLEWAGDYKIYYLADGEKNPFGQKTKKEVKDIVYSWIKNFQTSNDNLKIVVVACNTASVAIKDQVSNLEKKFKIPIVTMIDGVEKSVYENKKILKNKNTLILGTRLTINSRIYQNIIKTVGSLKIYQLEGTQTEKFIARGLEKNEKAKNVMQKELSKYTKKNIDAVLLGCTCYEFIKSQMNRIYGDNLFFLNPAKYVAVVTKEKLDIKKSKNIKLNKVLIYTTGNLRVWKKNINIIAEKIFNEKLNIKKIDIKR